MPSTDWARSDDHLEAGPVVVMLVGSVRIARPATVVQGGRLAEVVEPVL